MKNRLFALVLVLCFSRLCFAQIGETVDQLSRRYGPAVPLRSAHRPISNVVDDIYFFYPDDFKIAAHFKNGKAVMLQYIKKARNKRGKRPMNDGEVAAILRDAVKNPDWILISGNDRTRRWRSPDSTLYAYYFDSADRSPTRWLGPSSAVWVQTASVDAAYRAEQQNMRASLQKRDLTNR